MSTKEKLIERLKGLPKDFTFDEVTRLLSYFGYTQSNKGRTSGSRVMFINKQTNHKILIHRPHPGNIIKESALSGVIRSLNNKGIII